jgi:hypothetical protein
MATTASLQETVRRCTAAIVGTLGIGFGQLPGRWAELPLLIAVGAAVYLLWSAGLVPGWEELVDTE